MSLLNSQKHLNNQTPSLGPNLPRLDQYQKWVKKKYLIFEDAYNLCVDELHIKLKDLNIPKIESRMVEFAFVQDWLKGKISSEDVHNIFRGMNLEEVAKKRIIRKFVDHMFKYENSADYLKHVIQVMNTDIVPLYYDYLKLMAKYFEVLARIDQSQVPITWLEQIMPEEQGQSMKTQYKEMPMNQFIHTMDNWIIGSIQKKYAFMDNVLVFDETYEYGRVIHWVFASTDIAAILKELYDVKESLDNQEVERDYLAKMLEGI